MLQAVGSQRDPTQRLSRSKVLAEEESRMLSLCVRLTALSLKASGFSRVVAGVGVSFLFQAGS